MLNEKKVLFLGAGSMAESLIGGFIREELLTSEQITVTNKSDESRLTELENIYGVNTTDQVVEAVAAADIIVLAMKPKHLQDALPHLTNQIDNSKLVISVLAGVATSTIEADLKDHVAVVRAMPNTSAKVAASATALCQGTAAAKKDVDTARLLFSAIGTVTCTTEDKMNAVTGVSGSGPAYFYAACEAMEEAATEAGLSKEEARELIIQTMYGAAIRLEQSDKTAGELYKEVMSPGGTTEAAFEVLKSKAFQQTLREAVLQAKQKADELGRPAPEPKL
ncbi:pyrroline-5-carboxylate reductase [Salsuginibacillus halophilus]|uniref:Pyrroline-5-carboxylate reductase n=1 Tax=Salsuginibacillus halophilus TaxID=517424 RepID=A0A2P8HX46_9BACI|nr:pyrroline-5-carboxylate reductase [Salsuginibacillus halophilus]PSL50799.1 pyrroline-5-carboxylate reductase [Salsuginibacillus halophilus]